MQVSINVVEFNVRWRKLNWALQTKEDELQFFLRSKDKICDRLI